MRIYLDYSASTPVDPEVFEAMKPYFSDKFGNASSIHSFGREAEIGADEAREILSRFFEVDFGEVYFTSGATEANNWIVNEVLSSKYKVLSEKPHIITSLFEHESILEPIRRLEGKGLIEATYLKPSRDGFIDPMDVERALKQNTALVSIIYVNNEIGTVQPIKEIGKIIQAFRVKRLAVREKLNAKHYTLYPIFHTDAVQAIQFFEPRLDYIKVDAMTISAHKIYGPKGAGALITRKFVPSEPFLLGGGQEFEKRAGTLNVPAIIGFGKAVELLQDDNSRHKIIIQDTRLRDLKKRLKSGILKISPRVKITIEKEPLSPHILHCIFEDIESQVMLIALDQEGIAVSSGAACSAKAAKPSYVLTSLGYSEGQASHAIRFSLGIYTTEEEIDKTIEAIQKILKRFNRKSLNI